MISYIENPSHAHDIISRKDLIEKEFDKVFDDDFDMSNINSISRTIHVHPYVQFNFININTGTRIKFPEEDGMLKETDGLQFIFSICIDNSSVEKLLELFEFDYGDVEEFSEYIASTIIHICDTDVATIGEEIRDYIDLINSTSVDPLHQRSSIKDVCVYYTLALKHEIVSRRKEIREFLVYLYEELLLNMHVFYIKAYFTNKKSIGARLVQNYVLNKGGKNECEVYQTPAGWTYIYKHGIHYDEN